MTDTARTGGTHESPAGGFVYLVINEATGVGWIRFNRPRVRNALSRALIEEFIDALERFDESPSVRVIVVSGDEHAFSAGADTKELLHSPAILPVGLPRILDMSRVSKPIIAAVAGYALGGGCEIVLMADLVIAAESAKFGLPEIHLGIIPGAGGTQRLPRAIGPMKAADLILTGRYLSSKEAERAGLVSRLVPDGELDEAVQEIASEMAKRPLAALLAAKQAMQVAASEPIERGLELEQEIWHRLRGSSDRVPE